MNLNEKIIDTTLDKTLDKLYRRALDNCYISTEALEGNERLHFFDIHDEIDYRIQINHVRSRYSKSQIGLDPIPLPEGAHCPICIENVGSKDKENLESASLNIEGEEFFVQLTPFPLYHHHFVLITKQHRPMEISEDSFYKQLSFLERMPRYTVCSNSDRLDAGASILSHQHYQIFKKRHLPIFDTHVFDIMVKYDVQISLCNYPMSIIKLSSTSSDNQRKVFNALLGAWRGRDDKNTFNIVSRKLGEIFESYLILRNPKFNTPEHLKKFKYEGVGVIEACGEGILPTPEGKEAVDNMQSIRLEGKNILKGILSNLNPLSKEDCLCLIKSALSKSILR